MNSSFFPGQIAGRIAIATGSGGLPKAVVTTPFSTAEIYLHGAHVTCFQKRDEPPLLFLSQASRFSAGEPIRGGVPVIFPWFGPRTGALAHGFARLTPWELSKTAAEADGSVRLIFTLPESVSVQANWPVTRVNFIVTVSDKLAMELAVANVSPEDLGFENCLHTYFAVGDITRVSICGLQGLHYLDKAGDAGGARKLEAEPELRITRETNRVYVNATGAVEIRDETFRRKIVVEKSNSASTVVWNPWTTQKMPDDFAAGEYQRMVCVESGNVAENRLTLAPGQTSNLKVTLSTGAL